MKYIILCWVTLGMLLTVQAQITVKGQKKVADNYPQLVDYSSYLTPVRDAGPLNTRSAYAFLYAIEYQIFINSGKKIPLSALHLYYQCGNQEDTVYYNQGIKPQDAIRVLTTQGVVSEYTWPYDKRSGIPKLLNYVSLGDKYRVKEISLLFQDWEDKKFSRMKRNLSEFGPLVVEMKWPSSWNEVDGHTVLPDTLRVAPGEMGIKYICLTGFNEKEKYFFFKSANGVFWGDKGYGRIAYEDMEAFLLRAWEIRYK
jgi:hypothetical protein